MALTAGDVLKSVEVAELLGIPKRTVEDYARRGLLPNVTIGRHRFYLRSAIEAQLTESEIVRPIASNEDTGRVLGPNAAGYTKG
jgi:excisionase family DNA binding protein